MLRIRIINALVGHTVHVRSARSVTVRRASELNMTTGAPGHVALEGLSLLVLWDPHVRIQGRMKHQFRKSLQTQWSHLLSR